LRQFCRSLWYWVVTHSTQAWSPRVRFPVPEALTHFVEIMYIYIYFFFDNSKNVCIDFIGNVIREIKKKKSYDVR
jgi:hypothetical protein